jgi:sugar phosphate permease
MSLSQVELSIIQRPEAAAKDLSLRRPSTSRPSTLGRFSNETDRDAQSLHGLDIQSLHSLERTDTVTSKSRTVVIIICVTLVTAISTLLNGLTTVALPRMAKELSIPDGLLLWPTSIQALTNGCSLLIAGSVSDALGARFMYLVGCVLQVGTILGCGLSKTSTQIILFRGLSGIALSFCLPSAVAIITRSFVGKRRDFAFAAMGGGQPVSVHSLPRCSVLRTSN